MENNYTYTNIEAIYSSVKSNKELMNEIIKTVTDSDKEINRQMMSLSKEKVRLTEAQIQMYRGYTAEKERVKREMARFNETVLKDEQMKQLKIQSYKTDGDYSGIHKFYSRINDLQIRAMEIFCGILGRANALLMALKAPATI